MKVTTAFCSFLLFTGVSGIALVYVFDTFTAERAAAAQMKGETLEVSPTLVDVKKLPDAKPSSQSRDRILAPRIPIGRARLQEIKNDPASTSEGRLLSKNQPQPVVVKRVAKSPRNVSRFYNCTGNAFTGSAPSDSHGAVGKNGYIEVTNVDVGFYSRTACTSLIPRKSLKSFFGITDTATTAFDPRALYDFVNDRYVVTAETRKTSSTDQFQYFAVSKTNNPAGAYFVYKIRLSEGTTKFCKKAVSDFWDYPNAGYNKDRWFLGTNVFPTAGSAYGTILTITKAPTLVGGTATFRCYGTGSFAVQFNTAPPINRSSTSTIAYFLSPGSGSGSQLKKYTLNTSTDVLSGPVNIPLPNAWTAPPDASQPGVTQTLDTLDGRFQSASVQIGSTLWNTHAINFSGRALNKVYKVNASTNTSTLAVFLQSSATSFNWNPSFVTGSTSTTSPGFLTWSTTDPTNNLRASSDMLTGPNASSAGWFLTRAVTSSQSCTSNPVCRWGDYSSTTLDPLDFNQAFGVNQFLTGTSQFDWSTRITGIKFVP